MTTSNAVSGSLTPNVRWIGRADLREPSQPRFAWSGSGFVAEFHGCSLVAELDNHDKFLFKTLIDGVPQPAFAARRGRFPYVLASRLPLGPHQVALLRQTEGEYGDSRLLDLRVGEGALTAPSRGTRRLIEIAGDSISAGYGNLGRSARCAFSYATESHWHSYGAVAARQLNAEVSTIAISGRGLFRNHDGAGEPLPTSYARAIPFDPEAVWDFTDQPQAVVIALGTNDFILGDPGRAFVTAYLEFAREIRLRRPHAVIVCAIGPMLCDDSPLGTRSLSALRDHVQSVVDTRRGEADSRIRVLEFEPDSARLGCDRHPDARKHAEMGAALAAVLRRELGR